MAGRATACTAEGRFRIQHKSVRRTRSSNGPILRTPAE